VAAPVVWDDLKLEHGFRADLIVEGKVIVELKSIEALAPIHHKQLLTYLRITGLKLGLLINFNEALLKNGIRRIVNNL
jgi:GxxExxY protein